MKNIFKKLLVIGLATGISFNLFAGSSSASSIKDGKDKNGTYTVVTYTVSDLKKDIKLRNKSIKFYESNASAYCELLATSIVGVVSGGTALFLGATQIAAKKDMIKNMKAEQAEYKKLLKITSTAKHGIKVKRYYLRHYATGLGMVKNYYNGQIITKY